MLIRLLAVVALVWLLERGFGQLSPEPRPGTGHDRPGLPAASRSAPGGDLGQAAVAFAVTVSGGLLRLDFAAPVRVESIRIYGMRGGLLFTYRPGKVFPTVGWIWDGRDHRGRLLPRGRYQIQVQTDDGTSSRAVEWNPAT